MWCPSIAQLIYVELWELIPTEEGETFIRKPVGNFEVRKKYRAQRGIFEIEILKHLMCVCDGVYWGAIDRE